MLALVESSDQLKKEKRKCVFLKVILNLNLELKLPLTKSKIIENKMPLP